MITTDDVYGMLSHTLLYEQQLVKAIDEHSRQLDVTSFADFMLHKSQNHSIKIEGMERFSVEIFNQGRLYAKSYLHNGPITCHLFLSPAKSLSFPMHTDPDDVIIHCCEGVKSMVVDDTAIDIHPKSFLYIPHGTPHMALNSHTALTLSFGLERFLKDKINELGILS